MRFRTWPVVALALGGLLLLVALSVLATRRKVQEIYTQLDEVNTLHRNVDAKLRRLRADVHLSGIFIRDYLLDSSHLTGPFYRQRLTELRQTTTGTLRELEALVVSQDVERVRSLQAQLDEYWQTFDPLFDWTPRQKAAFSTLFLRREVLPRRDAVLSLAQDIEAFNNANAAEQRAQVALRERELNRYLNRMLWFSLCLGAAVAVAAVLRIRVLEKRSEEQHERTERAEQEMRRLSHQLVRAQEEERRSLSRELHDEVGQMLTALRMEVSKAERERHGANGAFGAAIAECKKLIDTILRTVRDLSMGLRPSMLDDFGLEPALNWQARDFSRRFNIAVNVAVEGDLERLPEPQRTCLYRVVQEALTNCARHARATQVDISVVGGEDRLHLVIRDNGVGLSPAARSAGGLGLLGIGERLREIHGTLSIDSAAGAGTTLRIQIPLARTPAEEQFADLAG